MLTNRILNKKEVLELINDEIDDDIMCKEMILVIHDAERGTFTLTNINGKNLPNVYKGLAKSTKKFFKKNK